MDNASNPDENLSEARMDRSNTDTGCSTLSGDTYGYSRTNSETSSFSEPNDENGSCEEPSPLGWPIAKSVARSPAILSRLGMKKYSHSLDEKSNNQEAIDSEELEMMKERFSKLLLGEDMSGSGKGVCTAAAISNAITNLYATVFGQFWRLEPLPPEKKSMWLREMECLLSVCDYIVEFLPCCQSFQDGTSLEARIRNPIETGFQKKIKISFFFSLLLTRVLKPGLDQMVRPVWTRTGLQNGPVMTSRPRSDIYINLPALQKLDTMLLEILESFSSTEFWYIEQGTLTSNPNSSGSFRRVIQRKEEKWWLPVPCVPLRGLSEKSRKQLQHKRECASQILKAAMAINSSVLAEMEVPETYIAALPKSGKASLGDSIHRYISSPDQFSPEHLLDCLNIASEHEALEVADRVEASLYVWRRKACINHSKSSWDMVKDLIADGDKNTTLAGRAESLLLCLKQRYPGLSQTSLDTCKIQYNKDVGQAILESYSRVLESLAFNMVAWIDDVLYVDGSMNRPISKTTAHFENSAGV